MKIWCDVCDKEEAWVFCCADEAALCHGCDRHVHLANKLASKHLRFSLSSPAGFTESPLCDICQERSGLLFCQEDRAILCRECDLPLHQANERTHRHNRFILSGIKLTALSPSYSKTFGQPGPIKIRPGSKSGEILSSHPTGTTPSPVSSEVFGSLSSTQQSTSTSNCCSQGFDENNNGMMSDCGSGGRSSTISEYLMEILPGWKVEDLLDHPSCVSSNNVVF